MILILILCYFGENLSALRLSLRGATCPKYWHISLQNKSAGQLFLCFCDMNNLGQWQLVLSTEILINKTTFLNFTNITGRTSVIFILTANKHLAWNYAALTYSIGNDAAFGQICTATFLCCARLQSETC